MAGKSHKTCEICPKRVSNGVCLIKGCWISPIHPVCDYGKRMIYNAYMAEYMRKKHGHKKRAPKDFCQNKTENNQ